MIRKFFISVCFSWNNDFISALFLLGVLISSFSQILLKKSAGQNGSSGIKAYFNPFVIMSYSLFVFSTLLSFLCLKFIPLSKAQVPDSAFYIFVAVLSRLFFNEKLNVRKVAGFIFIMAGIFVSSF